MTILHRVHVVIEARADRWSGCNSALNLTVASGGNDVFSGTWTGVNQLGANRTNGHTVPERGTGVALVPRDTDSRRALARPQPNILGAAHGDPWHAISYESPVDEDYYEAGIDTLTLEPSSIRLSNTGDDLLRPRRVVVWGMADLPPAGNPAVPGTRPTPVPLAFAPDLGVTLSNTFAEGPTSISLPRVAPWRRADGVERRVDMIVLTIGLGGSSNAPTPAPVTFRVVDTTGTIRASSALPSFNELKSNEWMTFGIAVDSPFTWPEIMSWPPGPPSCSLSVAGSNAVQLARVYAFGVDSTTTPNALLPLVHVETVGPDGMWISAADGPRLLVAANHDVSEAA